MSETESTPTPQEIREDMRRWVPTPEQVSAGVDAIAQAVAANPDVPAEEWLAVVALVQPGKRYGFWTFGQQVEPVAGVWVGRNTTDENVEPSYGDARNEAAAAAQAALGDREGTISYVTVEADGQAFVFEDFARS